MIKTSYRTFGTCSSQINVTLDGDTVADVEIVGGCQGNTVGVATLARGRKATDVIALLEGIPCGNKGTSCPDQLARALRQALQEQEQ